MGIAMMLQDPEKPGNHRFAGTVIKYRKTTSESAGTAAFDPVRVKYNSTLFMVFRILSLLCSDQKEKDTPYVIYSLSLPD
jgi:hypothetical protein